MKKLTIQDLRDQDLIIFETIAGSQAYGTATPTSDVDIRGVFMLPLSRIFGIEYQDQVSDETNDTTFYELGRFLQLVSTNNPNIIELLNSPEDCIIYKSSIFDMVLEHKDKFISKICKNSFGGYATQQIKKARGLNKKIVKKFEKERKGVLDFCYVPYKQGSICVKEYLEINDMEQQYCGLVSIPHMKNTYGVYYKGPNYDRVSYVMGAGLLATSDVIEHELPYLDKRERYYRGIVSDEKTAMDVCLSDIEKGAEMKFLLQFNSEGYSVYCKEYKEYWEWVEKRNPHRFSDNMLHGKGYDGKNMAHTLRLLEMALEIAEGKGINVRRENREKLLAVRKGEYEYENLLKEAEELMKKVEETFEQSMLPDVPDMEFIDELLYTIRKHRYRESFLD